MANRLVMSGRVDRCVEMMGQPQQSILLAKAVMLGTASFVSLGLGLGWTTPALGEEDAVDGDELYLDEVESPATTVAEWMAQIEASQVQITGIRVEPTETGLSVVLETTEGDLPTPTTQSVGNAVIAEISNAVLALPDGDSFEQFDPTEGIVLVSVTSLPANRVRVSITGTDAPPEAQVRTEAGNLVLSVMPGIAPEETEEIEEIELIVTATRTEEEEEDIPRSVTVVTREEIEEQSILTRNLQDILGKTVPGFGPPNQGVNLFGQSLRGRRPLVLIDGVPIRSNLSTIQARDLRSIAPSSVERVEVVRGPSAIYGDGGTGGVINIITREPSAEGLRSTVEVGVDASATEDSFLKGESFGNYLQYGLSVTEGNVDFLVNLSRTETGDAFDAEGDLIALGERGVADSETFDVLGKLGIDLSEGQRLELSASYFFDDFGASVFSDPVILDIPGIQKARARRTDVEYIGTEDPNNENAVINLTYTHENLFGSELHAQLFYRDNSYASEFLDGRDFDPPDLTQFKQDKERWGTRLQVETPFSEAFSLLWGADYSQEDVSATRPFFDIAEFEASGERVLRTTEERVDIPPYDLDTLGLFAQMQWDISEQWLLSGGLRYERFDFSVDDYTTAFAPRQDVEGGDLNFDDVVFNAGIVYKATDTISLYANFAQGFSSPDFGRLLEFPPDGFSVSKDLQVTQPQRVDNYEIGIRGNWSTVQFSLAGFFAESELGSRLRPNENVAEVVRAPERIYGVEATLDWQPADSWQLGTTLSWAEGESDEDEDGKFLALESSRIQPLKLTAYVENQTTPSWRNRLQLLYVGGRDRAFDDGTDPVEIDGYLILDLISSLQLGPGTLNLGIQNLLNEQYIPVEAQFLGGFFELSNVPARGRTVSLTYSVTF